jgi:hypothetical protein
MQQLVEQLPEIYPDAELAADLQIAYGGLASPSAALPGPPGRAPDVRVGE